jgi:hypothetical protein
MPKKNGPEVSKKAIQKQKQKAIEDKTFGLKNKSKSKKVQQQVESIQKNIMNSGDPKLRKLEEQRKKHKEEMKARKKAAKEEQEALFGAALLAVQKNKPTAAKIEAKGRDHNDDNAPKNSTSRAMKLMYQMDAQEMSEKLKQDNPNYVPTLEDEIEQQRQEKVKQLQGKGTPVTPETFAAWKERKRKQKADAVQKTVEQEFKKKKGGKGLSILSGRDLYEYKKELFVDREDDDIVSSNINGVSEAKVEQLAEHVNQELFLQDDDDLDDLEDD